jgi:hypothetical protein
MKGIDLTHDSLHVEVIFGFLKQLLMICKRFRNVDNYIFCWDSSTSKRKESYPEYKAKRINKEKTEEEEKFDKITMDQFKVLRRHVIPKMGFVNNFIQHKFESDDIIASIILDNPDDDWLLITSDQDMYQLLWTGLNIYSLHTRQLMYEQKFREKFYIKSQQWAMAKAIGGCATDEVEGIKGVSDPAKSDRSLALAYIRGDLKKGKVYDRIKSAEGQRIIKRNLPLVLLPYKGTNKFDIKRSSLWRKDFRDTFESYDFRSMLKESEFRMWETILNLN